MDEIRFGDHVLDRRRQRLRRGDDTVRIGVRALDLLELHLLHHDRVVGRGEIMNAAWLGTVVGDNNLNVQVANLRRLLGAEAIITVPGRGLTFALDVSVSAPALSLPDRPSVVVRPFDTLGGPPELDWLADGFVEDFTTELSRFRDLFVVARNSAFAYRRMPGDVRTIAWKLGVRYVVEGSVTAQLIDASHGGHV